MSATPQLALWSYGQGKSTPDLRASLGKAQLPGPHSNIFVGNIPQDMTEPDLTMLFSPFGDIESCRVMSKAGKTCGFVKFATTDAAERAISELNGVSGLLVKFASSSFGRPAGQGGKGPVKNGVSNGWGKGYHGQDWGGGKWGGYGWGTSPLTKWSPAEEEEGPEPPPVDNLYVSNLPVGITESEVRDTFSRVGHVVELRMLRPAHLQCAALVRMASLEQARAARTKLDGAVADGILPPLIARLQTKSGQTMEDHVYIRNIPVNSLESKVNHLVGRFGEVKWSAILPVASHHWRGNAPSSAALVEMGSAAEADAAIRALDGRILQMADIAPPMKIRYAENRKATEEADGAPSTNLYIKGWPVGFPELVLQATFQQWGTVVRLRVVENSDPEQPTCAALVQMATLQEAELAKRTLHGQTLTSPLPPMTIKFARKDQTPGDNLYITSLPRTITESALRATFSAFAPILRLRLLVQAGRPETHALVQLSSPEVAEAAMKALNGTAPKCKGPTIVVTYATNRLPQ